MKATKRLLLALLGVLMALPGLAADFTYTSGGVTLTYSTIDATTCAVKAGQTTTATTIVIPAQAGNYTVTEIAADAFKGRTTLQNITLAPTITKIGANAFSGCTSLAKVYIGPAITSIGASAFASDTKLTDIYITAQTPPTLTSTTFPTVSETFKPTLHVQGSTANTVYGNASYWNAFTRTMMTEVTNVQIGNGRNVDWGNFVNVTPGVSKTTQYNLFESASVTYTATFTPSTAEVARMFWQSSDPAKVAVDADGTITMKSLPSGNVTVTGTTIYNNTPQVKVTISPCKPYTYEGVTLYYKITNESANAKECYVAGAKSGLTSVIVPSTVTLDGVQYTVRGVSEVAFMAQTSLTSIKLPNTIKQLNYRAFHGSGLTEIELPKSLTTIAGAAFQATKLKSVVIPNSVTTLGGTHTFASISSLTSVTLSSKLTSIPSSTFNGVGIEEIVIPPSVTSIGSNAFYNCTKLKSVYMGPNVKTIAANAFNVETSKTPELAHIYITAQTPPTVSDNTFSRYDEVRLHLQQNTDGNIASVYKTAKNDDGTASAWQKFTTTDADLMLIPTNVRIGNGRNTAEGNFLNMAPGDTKTLNYTLHEGETVTYTPTFTPSNTTAKNMFWTSNNPDVAYVDNNGAITMVQPSMEMVTISGCTLYNNSPVVNVQVYSSYPYEYKGSKLYYRLTESNKVCSVAGADPDITEAHIPEKVVINGATYTVLTVREVAFMTQKALTTVTIPQTVTNIGFRAFHGCTALTSIELPKALTTISTGAFQGSGLTSINIPNAVTLIGYNAFDGSKLATVTIGSSVENIQASAFKNCPLTSVIIPPSVKTIGNDVFNGTKLTNVYMGPNVQSIGTNAFNAYDAKTKACTLTDIYLTAQTPPAIQSTTFPAYTAKLHLQQNEAGNIASVYNAAKNEDNTASAWQNFTTAATDLMVVPTNMRIFNDINVTWGNFLDIAPGETKSSAFTLHEDESVKYSAEFTPTGVTTSDMFWTSDAPAYVYAENDGTITMSALPKGKVTLSGRTLYDNSPVVKITVYPSQLADGDSDLYYRVTNETNKTCTVTGAKEGLTQIIIPEEASINGSKYTVTSIDDVAFIGRKELTSVSIPSKVRTIGFRSFHGCSGLTSIELPNALTNIHTAAFQGSGLKSIVIPNAVENIYYNAFDSSKLESVTLGSSVKNIYGSAFKNCLLTTVVIPPSVKTIGNEAFSGTQLTSVYMGPNVERIGTNTFNAYDSKKELTLKDIYITAQTPPAIQSNTFAAYKDVKLHLQQNEAGNIASVYKTAKNEDGSASAWQQFTPASDDLLIVPTNMRIGNGKNVDIGNYKDIAPGQTVTAYFAQHEGQTVTYTATFTPSNTTIPDMFWTSTSPMEVYANNAGEITMNSIPAGTVELFGRTLYDNSPVIRVVITPSYPYEHEGVTLYYRKVSESDKTCSVAGSDDNITSAIIPETAEIDGEIYKVTSIGEVAFIGQKALSTVTIPNTVTTIGFRAFYNSGLTTVNIPTSVTTLHTAAFQGTKLISIKIPNSVTTMMSNCFQGSPLTDVKLSSGLKEITGYAFAGCPLTTVVIPPAVTSIGNYAFSNTKLTKVYMGAKVSSIGQAAFNASTITDVYVTAQTVPALTDSSFPASVKSVATLHVQGGKTQQDAYKSAWGFTKEAVITKPHVEMKLTMSESGSRQVKRKADVVTTTEDHIYGLTGQTHQRAATLVGENGESVDITNVFWSSDNNSKVYADHDGTITINEAPELHKPVTVTAQSLYANAPARTVTVDHEMMTDVEEISLDEDLDMTHGHIFTTDGVYVGESVKTLAPGVYILRQGNKAYKIYIK